MSLTIEPSEFNALKTNGQINRNSQAAKINEAGDLVAAFIASAAPEDYEVSGSHIGANQLFYSIEVKSPSTKKSVVVIIEQFGEVTVKSNKGSGSVIESDDITFPPETYPEQIDSVVCAALSRKADRPFKDIGIDLQEALRKEYAQHEEVTTPAATKVPIPSSGRRDLIGQLRP